MKKSSELKIFMTGALIIMGILQLTVAVIQVILMMAK